MTQNMVICVNCAYNTKGGLLGYYMHLTHAVVQYCFWEAIKQATTDGTKRMCQLPIDCTTSI